MKYDVRPRRNPIKKDQKLFYAAPVNSGNIEIDQITKEIANISALSRGDVMNVLEALLDVVPKYLSQGYSVKLGNFGTFRLSFSSKGVEKPEMVDPSLIKSKKIIFSSGVKLKKEVEDTKFEKAKSSGETVKPVV